MQYKVSDIVKEVRIALDENEVSVPLIAEDSNTLSLDEIILQKLPHAVRTVSESAPFPMMQDAPELPATNLSFDETGAGKIDLPSDFLRLVIFRMSDWKRGCAEPIDETDAEYTAQKSQFAGVRGNAQKPVCAIVTGMNGQVLEFYSCDTPAATIDTAKYIKIPAIQGQGEEATIEICEQLLVPVVYYTAGLTAAAYKADNADTLFKLATDYLEP